MICLLKTTVLVLIFATLSSGQPDPPVARIFSKIWPNFENISITVATTEEDFSYDLFDNFIAYTELNDYLDGSSFGLELWWIVFSRLGMTFKIAIPQGSSKNSLSAVTQMVINGDAQVAVVPTVFVPEETKGLAITQPTHSTRYKLFVQSPLSVSTSLSLGKVFTPVLWLAIIVSMLMMGVILIFIEFVGQKAKIRSYLATPADIGQIVIVIIGCFCYQGAIQIASGCSGRVLVWTSLICGYLIYVSYNTLVISQLTTVSFKPPFESLQDMAAKGTHQLIVRNQTALLDDIKITRIKDGKRGILADIWDQLLPMKPKPENLYNSRSAVARLCKEKIALLDSELEINAAVQQKYKCNAISLKDSYFRSNLGFVLSKNNTFNPAVIRLFNRMREMGIINRMRRYLDQPDVGPLQPLPTLNPIPLETLIPMLVVLYFGMFLSLLTLGLEIVFSRKGKQLIQLMEAKGFTTWRDIICFWKTIKRQRELAALEAGLNDSEDDEEDDDAGQSPKSKQMANFSSTLFKIKSKKNKMLSKKKAKAEIDAKTMDDLLDADDDEIILPPAYPKTPVKAPVKGSEDIVPARRVLRRQDRVADLTTLLPKRITASLTPVYLDKNLVRDPDSSQGSNNTDTPPLELPENTPPMVPSHRNSQEMKSDGSNQADRRSNNLAIPRSGRNSNAVSPKPSPRYDPQDLLRPKPPVSRAEEAPESNRPTPSPREMRRYVNDPQDVIRPPSKADEIKEGYSPSIPSRRVHPPPIEEQRYVNVIPTPSPREVPNQRQVDQSPEHNVRKRSNQSSPRPQSITPPSQQASPKKSRKHDFVPLYYDEQELPRRERRTRPGIDRSPERQRAPPAPPLYRNLQLSTDSDGFLNGHSILDRNLARRIRNNQEPDPFDGFD